MKFLEQYRNLSQANFLTGTVQVDHTLCTGCNQCVKICPSSALTLEEDKEGEKKALMQPESACISCGACMAVCETKSITISRFWHVPDGAFKTEGKKQPIDMRSYPRIFGEKD